MSQEFDYDDYEAVKGELGRRSLPISGVPSEDVQRLKVAAGQEDWDGNSTDSPTRDSDTGVVDPRTDSNSTEYDPNYDPNA